MVVFTVSLVAALQDALEGAVVLFLVYSALTFLFVDMYRFADLLISLEGVFRYPDIVRWQDVLDIRDTRWSLSLRLARGRRISISRLVYRVSNEDVQFMRQLAKQPSIASGASKEDTGGREVPWFEAVVAAIARILTVATGLLALLSLVYWLLLR